MEEKVIVEEIINGNKECFKVIAKTYYQPIYAYLYKQVLNQEEAFDLTQDVFVKVYQNLRKYDGNKASLKNWIYQIATNRCVDYFRSKAYKMRLLTKEMDEEFGCYGNLLDDLVNKETIDKIIEIINQNFKVKHQKVIKLFFFSGLDVKEVAQILEIPIKTIYSIIDLSVNKIKKELEERI